MQYARRGRSTFSPPIRDKRSALRKALWSSRCGEGLNQLRAGSKHGSAKKRERAAAPKERARDSSNYAARENGQLEIESRLINRGKTALYHIGLIRAQSLEQ
jgi:hypothetical protein